MVDHQLKQFQHQKFQTKRSQRARNDKSNKRIIRFNKRNGKFAKVRRRFRKETSTYIVRAWDFRYY